MYSAALINDPFGDPGVYVENKYRRETRRQHLGLPLLRAEGHGKSR